MSSDLRDIEVGDEVFRETMSSEHAHNEVSTATDCYASGPWRLMHVPGDCWDIVAADLTTVVEAVPNYPDARLVAAAPLLLAALRPFANLCDGDPDSVRCGTVLGPDGRLTAGMIQAAKNAIAAVGV